MAAWRNTYACSDVNDDESLNSECEDEVLSSEQLEISTESDLSECSSVSTAKSKSSSSRKAGRKAVWREKVITDMVDIICSSEYLRKNLIFRNTTRARSSLRNDSLAAERIFLSTCLKQGTNLRNVLLNARKQL